MCLVGVAIRAHPHYRLVVAANRDEFHARPASPASEWSDRPGAYGGRDLAAGGAWLAADRRGRLAVVTNVRRLPLADGRRSRGMLVRDWLQSDQPIAAAHLDLTACSGEFAPFNLIFGDIDQLYYHSRDLASPTPLTASIHTLSNAALDTPWPKTVRLSTRMRDWCEHADPAVDALLAALGDSAPANDNDLPDTGMGLDRERFLSSPFIVSEAYGTRCGTIYTVDHQGSARLLERSFGPLGKPLGEVELRWQIAADE